MAYILALFMILLQMVQNNSLLVRARVIKARILGANIGKNVKLRQNVVLKGHRNISIGDNCFIGENTVIVAYESSINIGNNVLIAENSYLNTRNHRFRDPDKLIRYQGYKSSSISVNDDVWLGRGAVVLAGTEIASKCVIGANCVVSGKLEKGVYQQKIVVSQYEN